MFQGSVAVSPVWFGISAVVALAYGRLVSQFDHNMGMTLGLCNKANQGQKFDLGERKNCAKLLQKRLNDLDRRVKVFSMNEQSDYQSNDLGDLQSGYITTTVNERILRGSGDDGVAIQRAMGLDGSVSG